MTTSHQPKILLTGATGFIGGSILAHLLSSTHPFLQHTTITCLLRDPSRASKLTSVYGSRVSTLIYDSIDDLPATEAAAAQHDIVINTTIGYHAASGEALVRGLAQRKAETGHDVWIIHTSGTSNLADQPITKTWMNEDDPDGWELDDARDDVYAYEKMREALSAYPQRTAELNIIDTSLSLSVNSLVIMSPTIYGLGTGLFNNLSIQLISYIRTILGHGHGVVVGPGSGVWDHVHIADLCSLYSLILLDILDPSSHGSKLPTGKKGIIFSANGRATWEDVAQGVADACVAEGRIKDAQVEHVSMERGIEIFSGYLGERVSPEHLELGLSSNSRTVASVARGLGWKPSSGEEAWRKGFGDDVREVLEREKRVE